MRYVLLAAFALIWVSTGCDTETGSFKAGAAEKIAAEKGLRPGGSGPTVAPKIVKRGRITTTTEPGGTPLPKP